MIFSWWVYHDFWPCAFVRWNEKAVTPARSNGWRTPSSNQITSLWKHLFNNQPTGNLFWWRCESGRYVWGEVVYDMVVGDWYSEGMWKKEGETWLYMAGEIVTRKRRYFMWSSTMLFFFFVPPFRFSESIAWYTTTSPARFHSNTSGQYLPLYRYIAQNHLIRMDGKRI